MTFVPHWHARYGGRYGGPPDDAAELMLEKLVPRGERLPCGHPFWGGCLCGAKAKQDRESDAT